MKKMISIILAAVLMVAFLARGKAVGAEQSSAAGNSTLNAASLSSDAFTFTDDETARINALDRGEKHDWY